MTLPSIDTTTTIGTQDPKEQLTTNLKTLAGLNRALEENQAWLEAKEEKLKALPEYQEVERIQVERQQIKDRIDQARERVNELTLDLYNATGDKKPADGVGVRIYRVLEYDQEKALTWCKEHLEPALKLDKRTFEKYAKGVEDVQPLEFVDYLDEPRPTIAGDLSEYLD